MRCEVVKVNGLYSEHFLKCCQDCEQSRFLNRAKPSHEPPAIENSDLLQENEALLTGKLRGNTVWSRPTPRRQRRSEHQRKMIVNIRRRHDEAWPHFLNFAPLCRIEPCKPYVTAVYHL